MEATRTHNFKIIIRVHKEIIKSLHLLLEKTQFIKTVKIKLKPVSYLFQEIAMLQVAIKKIKLLDH
jgi:hypothetical protein